MASRQPAKYPNSKASAMQPWLQKLLERIEEDVSWEDANNARRKQLKQDYAGDDTFAREVRDVTQALLRAPRIESVWQALERRSDPNAITLCEEAYRAGAESARSWLAAGETDSIETRKTLSRWCLDRELQLLQGAEEQSGYEVGRHIHDMAYDLIGNLTEIRAEPIPMDTSSRRREKLQEVAGLVDRLKQAIQPLYNGTRQYVKHSSTQLSALDEHATAMANEWIEPYAMMRFCEIDKEAVAVANQVAKSIVRHPSSALDALVADIAEWANEAPELSRPNDPNAARLFFIRRLTSYFRRVYGTPLRGCVLAVTEAFFDCGTLDEAAIAKLAP